MDPVLSRLTSKLEIFEYQDQSDSTPRIRLCWHTTSGVTQVEVRFKSPVTDSAKSLMRRYVNEFRSWRSTDRDQVLSAERRMLSLGRALGDALVDEDYLLVQFCDEMERVGLSQLQVAVYVDRPSLVQIPWELLILPDSAYVLSATSAALVRAPSTAASVFDCEVQRLDLSEKHPLGYLRLNGSTTLVDDSLLWRQFRFNGAFQYRFEHTSGLNAIEDRYNDTRFQIVHWSGPLAMIDGVAQISCGVPEVTEQWLPVVDFVGRIRKLGAVLLILESDSDSSPAAHAAALDAFKEELNNIIVVTDPIIRGWPSNWIDELLQGLHNGLGLRRAVVETRKQLQRSLLEARNEAEERLHAAQNWHTLCHYSRSDVVFFDAPVQIAALESSQAYRVLLATLFGFRFDHLPPWAPQADDTALFNLLDRLRKENGIGVSAPHGAGLTHALHRAALTLRANEEIERAYYWDFAREIFTLRDLAQMVASARLQSEPEKATIESILNGPHGEHELFVFDNLDAFEGTADDRLEELVGLTRRLMSVGAHCLLAFHPSATATDRVPTLMSPLTTIELPPLSERESITLVSAKAPKAPVLLPRFITLLDELDGNALLIQKITSQCNKDNLDNLIEEARRCYGKTATTASHARVRFFYLERLQQLESPLRSLLSLLLPLQGLILQIVMIATDRRNGEFSKSGYALWEHLGIDQSTRFGEAISQLTTAGFVVTDSAGSYIDESARDFIKTLDGPELAHLDRAQSLVAQLLCDGLVALFEQLRRNPMSDIISNLLKHRTAIGKQIELLMREGEYLRAARAFLVLQAQLLRSNLRTDSATLAGSLLNAAGPAMFMETDAATQTAWLSMAIGALGETSVLRAELQQAAVEHFQDILISPKQENDQALRSMIPLVTRWLEQIYEHRKEPAKYRDVAVRACEYYRETDNQNALLEQLRVLAIVQHELGEHEQRDRTENEILKAEDHATTPQQLAIALQAVAALASIRLRRGDTDGCEQLLLRLEKKENKQDAVTAESQALSTAILAIRLELAMVREQWEQAAAQICTLWKLALGGNRSIDVDRTAERIFEIEERLGSDTFERLYSEYAGDTPTPSAMGITRRTGKR